MNYDSCTMKPTTSKLAVEEGAPGSFCIEDAADGEQSYKRLWAKLPDGTVGGFALEPAPAHIPGIWAWNGNAKKPTLKRPITLRGRWCGQIKAGRMVSDPAPAMPESAIEHPTADAVRDSKVDRKVSSPSLIDASPIYPRPCPNPRRPAPSARGSVPASHSPPNEARQ